MKKYSYGWITLGFFLFSLAGHWLFGWHAHVSEQAAQGQAIQVSSYLVEMTRDTLENWQSEFLQLLWQVGGLSLFLWQNSPQSKEGDERKEEKINAILRTLDPAGADGMIQKIDAQYEA